MNDDVPDKDRLIGTCSLLPIRFDVDRFLLEFLRIPTELWGTTGGRVGVHSQSEAIFLRGHAPVEGDLPIEDRPILTRLPNARELIYSIPASPRRCLFAKVKPLGRIAPHIDQGDYFRKTIRLHFPVVTNDAVSMSVEGILFTLRPGEIWALNNSKMHAVRNDHTTESRTHMICDYLPTNELLALLEQGNRSLGRPVEK